MVQDAGGLARHLTGLLSGPALAGWPAAAASREAVWKLRFCLAVGHFLGSTAWGRISVAQGGAGAAEAALS